ncbi:hypothetical protein GGH95_005371, partial [Coemansia sp. RSA 1836]
MPRRKSAAAAQRKQKGKEKQHIASSGAAGALPSDVLNLVYDFLSHTKSPQIYTSRQLLKRLDGLLLMASVNRLWRAFALPLFCQTAVVYCDNAAYQRRAHGGGSGDRGIRTNMGLLREMGHSDTTRNIRIVICGGTLTSYQLAHKLRRVGFDMVWPGVERLSVAIDDSSDEGFREVAMSRGLISAKVLRGLPIPGDLGTPDDLNELLMIALPSLSEIVWLDNYRYYVDTPISLSWLTSERLRGPEPLRALQVASGAIPEVLTAYSPPPDSATAPAPIKIACLGIENMDRRSPLRPPPVFASTLVELTLDPVAKDEIWELFVADTTQLEFPCLRVLTLHFDDPQCGVMLPYNDEEMATSRCLTSTKFGTPLFPALTSLKICKFPGHLNQFLSLFAASPLSKLYIGGFNRLIPDELDLTPFTGLRSFG